MKIKLKTFAACMLFAATAALSCAVLSPKNGREAQAKSGADSCDERTVFYPEEELYPKAAAVTEFNDVAEQTSYLYSRIGLEKNGKNVLDVTRGATDKHRSVVVVIDSGVTYNHKEFLDEEGNTRLSERSYSVAARSTVAKSGWSIMTDVEVTGSSYHGTQVCGSIFASSKNNTGIYGLAEDAELIVVKVPFSETGGYAVEDVNAALDYAISIKPDVVNMSMGNYISSNYFSSRMRTLKNNGAVVIAAAGNESRSDSHYPSADRSTVGIGAFGNLKNLAASNTSYPLASYSSYGDVNVNMCAPGLFWQTYTDANGSTLYTLSNGTSVAAPVVSAAVALYKSLYPEATPDEVIAKLYSSCTDQGDAGKDYEFGYGGLHIYDFLFGEQGEVTFDFNNGTRTTVSITEGVALQEYPFPESNLLGKAFGGWYSDRACTKPVKYYQQVFSNGDTVYAKWTEIDTAGAYDYTITKGGNEAVIKGYYGNAERVILPEEITTGGKNYPVKKIAARAFERSALKKIVLPTSVTTIDEYAFANARYDFVWLPTTLRSVKLYAFYGTTTTLYLQGENNTGNSSIYAVSSSRPVAAWNQSATLTLHAQSGNYSYENGVEQIGSTLLCYDGAGEELVLSASKPVQTVLDGAAKGNTALRKVVLPNATTIGASAFEGCTALASLSVPALEEMGERAFFGCSALASVALPASLRSVSVSAFANCSGLQTVDFSACTALAAVGASAFKNCTSLVSVDLQNANSLTGVGNEAFAGCEKLFAVALPSQTAMIGSSVFSGCNALSALKLPFVGRTGETGTFGNFGYIFGSSSTEAQVRFVPASLSFVYITGDRTIGVSALQNLSGFTLFTNGNFAGQADCTVYQNGAFSLVELYHDGAFCGMYGGERGGAIDRTLFDRAYALAQGVTAQGIDTDGNGVIDTLPQSLPAQNGEWHVLSSANANYTVIFYDEKGVELARTTYSYGDYVSAPTVPVPAATAEYRFVFAGWDKPITAVYANAEYHAVFTAVRRVYEITFLDGDSVAKVEAVAYGETPVPPTMQNKPVDAQYYEQFKGWNASVSPVTGAAQYNAVYERKLVEYTVSFVYADTGVVFATKTYHYGDSVVAPDTARDADQTYTYQFRAWRTAFEQVTADATYVAEYNKSYVEYTITFTDYDGSTISAQTYHYGETPVVPADPTRPDDDEYSYTFTGWDKNVVVVVGNAVYTAQYSRRAANLVCIRFLVDNAVISSEWYEKGTEIVVPADPEKSVSGGNYFYVFTGWSPAISPLATDDADYVASFQRMVTVRFLDYDGSVIVSKNYVQNAAIERPADPVRAADGEVCAYAFAGWDKTVPQKASASADYKATYTALQHDYELKNTQNADCTHDGYREYACTQCAKSYRETIEATGHTVGDWIVDKQAEVGVKGHRHKECSVCHTVTEEEDLPALPDTGDNPPAKPGGCASQTAALPVSLALLCGLAALSVTLASVMKKKK